MMLRTCQTCIDQGKRASEVSFFSMSTWRAHKKWHEEKGEKARMVRKK